MEAGWDDFWHWGGNEGGLGNNGNTVEVIGARLVARKRKGVFRRKTPESEYRGLP